MKIARLGDGCSPARPPRRVLFADLSPTASFGRWPAWALVPVECLNLDLFDENGNHILETEVQNGTRREG